MRTRSAAGLVLALALGLAGCGVPGSSSPTVVGTAAAAGDPVNQAGAVKLPGRDGASTATELAERFLQAGAAADWDPDREEDKRIQMATNHAMQFLDPDLRKEWHPGNVILVVDAVVTEILDFVTAKVVPVGVLEVNGVVRPLRANEAGSMELKFQAVNANGTMLLSRAAPDSPMPSNVMLSLAGLRTLFEDRAVYFFDKSGQYLVPDRRYVNRGMSDEKRIRVIIEQWLSGPSDFLKDFVAGPDVPATLDNPSLDGNRVTVNLPPGVQKPDQPDGLRRIAAQIRWSVHRGSSSLAVEIQVNGRKQYDDTGTEFLELNPSQPRAGHAAPAEDRLFAVMNGQVVAVSARASVPSILQNPDNSKVVLAAVHRTNNVAALVRRVDGNLEFVLGHNGAEPAYQKVTFPLSANPKAMSRPSFLPGTGGRVLVAVDGALYDVALDGRAQLVPLPQLPGPVTAVSVAPDGARVAFVAGGKAVVAPLDSTTARATIGTVLVLYTPNVDQARGIGWLYDDRVIVAGAATMAEVAIDNGPFDKFEPKNLPGSQLTQVSAVPGNPFDGTRGSVVVEAGSPQQAYYAFDSLQKITPLPAASPAPSASAGAGAGTTPTMSAPFYVDDVK